MTRAETTVANEAGEQCCREQRRDEESSRT
jgi:hypothetical protein